jgi:hypothetical protein
MANVFKVMVDFIVNVMWDILEINVNVSYNCKVCHGARNIESA